MTPDEIAALPTPLMDTRWEEVFNGRCLPNCDSYDHEIDCPVCYPDKLMADYARSFEQDRAALMAELNDILQWALYEKSPLREQEIKSIRATIAAVRQRQEAKNG